MFNKKSLLITGGTGSFGKEWVKYILHKHKSLKNWLFLVAMNSSNMRWKKV